MVLLQFTSSSRSSCYSIQLNPHSPHAIPQLPSCHLRRLCNILYRMNQLLFNFNAISQYLKYYFSDNKSQIAAKQVGSPNFYKISVSDHRILIAVSATYYDVTRTSRFSYQPVIHFLSTSFQLSIYSMVRICYRNVSCNLCARNNLCAQFLSSKGDLLYR